MVTTLENIMHGLEDGDVVTFKEVQGMETINGKQATVKGKSRDCAALDVLSSSFLKVIPLYMLLLFWG